MIKKIKTKKMQANQTKNTAERKNSKTLIYQIKEKNSTIMCCMCMC